MQRTEHGTTVQGTPFRQHARGAHAHVALRACVRLMTALPRALTKIAAWNLVPPVVSTAASWLTIQAVPVCNPSPYAVGECASSETLAQTLLVGEFVGVWAFIGIGAFVSAPPFCCRLGSVCPQPTQSECLACLTLSLRLTKRLNGRHAAQSREAPLCTLHFASPRRTAPLNTDVTPETTWKHEKALAHRSPHTVATSRIRSFSRAVPQACRAGGIAVRRPRIPTRVSRGCARTVVRTPGDVAPASINDRLPRILAMRRVAVLPVRARSALVATGWCYCCHGRRSVRSDRPALEILWKALRTRTRRPTAYHFPTRLGALRRARFACTQAEAA